MAAVADLPPLPPSEDEIGPPLQGLRTQEEVEQPGSNWSLRQECDINHVALIHSSKVMKLEKGKLQIRIFFYYFFAIDCWRLP